MHNEIKKIEIVIPVFNDWESVVILIDKIRSCFDKETVQCIYFTIVNDCSTIALQKFISNDTSNIRIINLNHNLGHQKAIAIGLAYIAEQNDADYVVVMDSDGEDKPEDVGTIITTALYNKQTIVFGKRCKRQETFIFKFFYRIYKFLFRILTGKMISFGNFCVIPRNILKHVVSVSEIWNHFSGGIIRSKLEYITIPLERGKRLRGKSKMNFTSLILHGLSSVAVYVDIVAIRLLILTFFLILFSLLGIGVVTGIRLFTDLAIPGWATYAVTGFSIILLQAFLQSLVLAFIVLNYRTQKLFIPAIDYKNYIIDVKQV